ncbi:MAG: DUF2306 domain-containing protein, partial [Rubripirellula sp.]
MLILTPYPHYYPPNFEFGFLRDKRSFFFTSGYYIGFYAHIVTAPLAILVGTLQLSSTIRLRYRRTHERLGKLYVALVLFGAAPGGAIMAWFAL